MLKAYEAHKLLVLWRECINSLRCTVTVDGLRRNGCLVWRCLTVSFGVENLNPGHGYTLLKHTQNNVLVTLLLACISGSCFLSVSASGRVLSLS